MERLYHRCREELPGHHVVLIVANQTTGETAALTELAHEQLADLFITIVEANDPKPMDDWNPKQ